MKVSMHHDAFLFRIYEQLFCSSPVLFVASRHLFGIVHFLPGKASF